MRIHAYVLFCIAAESRTTFDSGVGELIVNAFPWSEGSTILFAANANVTYRCSQSEGPLFNCKLELQICLLNSKLRLQNDTKSEVLYIYSLIPTCMQVKVHMISQKVPQVLRVNLVFWL